MDVIGTIDGRFSDPEAVPSEWPLVREVLAGAELYWLSTVRADARPHVTPLVGLWDGEAGYVTAGPREQKAHNLRVHPAVALTTGTNVWDDGMDVVVEGVVELVAQAAELHRVADSYLAKYGQAWRFKVVEGGFGEGELFSEVFRIRPVKVLAFAKRPHGQTTFRFG